jgi:hypothetical protein
VSALIALSLAGVVSVREARAQAPNGGRLSIRGGIDAPTVYVFRGVVQEVEPRLTLTPHLTVGVALRESGRLRADIGIWNSFNTGTSGSGGPLRGSHYAERLSASVTIAGPRGLTVTPGYLANSSANRGYETIHELNLAVGRPGRFAPYALLAFELSDTGQVDEGARKGRYLELGAVPSFDLPFWRLRLTTPARVGASLGDYYERFGKDLRFKDHRFGFVEAGGHVDVPVSSPTSRFGAWRAEGGVDVYAFGDSTQAFNRGRKSRVVGTVGLSFAY